ncbi:MAG: GspH/FimT family pseudopilin [Gemmatimonadales bacterium]
MERGPGVGFTLAEALLVTTAIGLVALIAFPSLVRARARVDVAAAREAFAATHSLARQVAAQYGRLCRLHLDPGDNRFWVTVDTSAIPGAAVLDTVQPVVRVAEQFGGVQIDAAPHTFCFDARGLATARADCDLPNATVVFRRGGVRETVSISRLGRLFLR